MTLVEVIVALAITGLMVAGIIRGYIYCATSAVKAELAQAANAKAMQRIEETRSAQWNTSSSLAVDLLVATNFPDKSVTSATIKTTISQISLTPPLRRIRADCIWQFRGAEWVTNSIETIRAADQ
jgi:type II secretory pathway pseudopilin PulG